MKAEEIASKGICIGEDDDTYAVGYSYCIEAMKKFAQQEVDRALNKAYQLSYEDKESIIDCYEVQ